MSRSYTLLLFILFALSTFATDPTATNYSFKECRGTLSPYPADNSITAYPDSLTPVYISHVGRHGSRFPASSTHAMQLLRYLNTADSLGTITNTGKRLKEVTEYVIATSAGRWGALDSLGMAEHRGIASRMYMAYKTVFDNAKIRAISSYSPRCLMSMMCFVHQLDRLNNKIEITTSTGRSNSPLMRPFDIDNDYLDFRQAGRWSQPYEDFVNTFVPTTAICRAIGNNTGLSDEELRQAAITEYYVIAGLDAMGLDANEAEFFTKDEINRLWSAFNLRQYLQRAANTISSVPADIASPLLLDIIDGTDRFINGKDDTNVVLRFGHAETLMPLLSLMRVPEAYYMTNYFDTVRQHWLDFKTFPMAANLQMVLYKTAKGKFYVRFDINEKPVKLIPGDDRTYLPWETARTQLMKYIPMYYQM